jgi:LL-diaminopimelate aminotransferase
LSLTQNNDSVPLVQTDALHRLPPYVFAELDRLKAAARARGATLVDLGIGSPDIPTAPGIIEALTTAARDPSTHGYPPFRGLPRFLDSIGRFMESRFGVTIEPATETIALSGAKEGIAHLIAALCSRGDVVLVPEIYYPVYARAAWLAGAEVYLVPMPAERGFMLDLDAIPADVARHAKLLIVNYPNNPTGAQVELEFYDRAVAFARQHDLLLVSDLAYGELTFGDTPAPSALQSDSAHDVTIEFHSCSKTFSMAGFRIGFAVGNAQAIEALAAYRTNVGYGTPTAVQHAAAYALDHRMEIVPGKVKEYRERRDAAVAAFAAAGWQIPVPTASMYLWIPVPDGVDDWRWVRTLIDQDGVVVTPGVAFGEAGRGWFRISLVRDSATLASTARTIAARRAHHVA